MTLTRGQNPGHAAWQLDSAWKDNRGEGFDHQTHKLLMLSISYDAVCEILKLALNAVGIFSFMSDVWFQSWDYLPAA